MGCESLRAGPVSCFVSPEIHAEGPQQTLVDEKASFISLFMIDSLKKGEKVCGIELSQIEFLWAFVPPALKCVWRSQVAPALGLGFFCRIWFSERDANSRSGLAHPQTLLFHILTLFPNKVNFLPL